MILILAKIEGFHLCHPDFTGMRSIEMGIGSFTKAADALGYTQPAMSQMIASLERELSIKLLYRSKYGIHLTIYFAPGGQRYYFYVDQNRRGLFRVRKS